MIFYSWWQIVWALVGAFGTAAMHQHTGRDPRFGGLIGLAVGYFFGPFFLVSLWIWLYYRRLNTHYIRSYRKWWEWWRP